MKNNKVIGLLLLILAISTIIGMAANNDTYWAIYNYLTIILSVVYGIALLRQK